MKTFLTQDQLADYLSRCNYPSKLKDSLQSSLLAVELIRNNVDNAIAALVMVENDEEIALVRSKYNLADILPDIDVTDTQNNVTWQKQVFISSDFGDGIALFKICHFEPFICPVAGVLKMQSVDQDGLNRHTEVQQHPQVPQAHSKKEF